MTGVLLAARTDTPAARLRSATGEPVWPVDGPAAHERVAAIASVLDLRLRYVPAAAASTEAQREGLVVGLGGDAWPAAALHAHLTGRRFVGLDEPHQPLPQDTEVVVVESGDLSPGLLARVHDRASTAGCVGIVTAADAAALTRQVLTRAVGGVFAAPNTGELHVWPRAPLATGPTPLGTMLGGRASREALCSAWGGRSSSVHLETHSDGLCASLGDRVLCPMDRPPVEPGDDPPLCVASGTCHRLDVPFDAVRDDEAIVGVSTIAAPVVISATCWGVVSSPFLWDTRWSLGQRMIDSPTIGALVAPWELFFRQREVEAPLRRAIVAGDTLGQALAAQRCDEASARAGYRFALFGDPRFRLARPSRSIPADRACPPARLAASPPAASPSATCAPTGLARARAFVRTLLSSRKLTEQSETTREASAEARAALAAVDAHAEDGLVPWDAELTMRTTALRLLATFDGALPHLWAGASEGMAVVADDRRCIVCDCASRTYVGRLRLDPPQTRRLLVCPRCGIVEDADADTAPVVARIAEGHVGFHGVAEDRAWPLAIKRTTFRAAETVVDVVVVTPDRQQIPLPSPAAPGLHFFQFALFTSTGIASLWCPVH